MRLREHQRFFYFYAHAGLFPVATERQISHVIDTPESASRIIAERGETLVQEISNQIRAGDNGRIWLLLPYYWLTDRTRRADPTFAAAPLFVLALLACFWGMVLARKYVLATALVLLAGSNSFQIFEAYKNPNVFSLPITICLLMIGLHAPLMFRFEDDHWPRPLRAAMVWCLPVVSGALLATVREVRTEPALIVIPLIVIYATVPNVRRWQRFLLPAVLVLVFAIVGKGWSSYWQASFDESARVVEAAGGHPLPAGIRQSHHEMWHPLWSGLSDFGSARGFAWGDVPAYEAALPALNAELGMQLELGGPPEGNLAGKYFLDDYYDEARKYRKKIGDLPEYHAEIGRLVRDAIRADPIWYLGILAQRGHRILTEKPPARVAVGNTALLSLSLHGAFFVLLAAWLLWRREWGFLKLMLLASSTSVTSLLIYSGGGVTYYALYHLAGWAILADLAARAGRSPKP